MTTLAQAEQTLEQFQNSKGAKLVRANFNPSANREVEEIKTATAHLINMCELLKEHDPRLSALAITAYEEAAMWAVKLVTTEIKIKE